MNHDPQTEARAAAAHAESDDWKHRPRRGVAVVVFHPTHAASLSASLDGDGATVWCSEEVGSTVSLLLSLEQARQAHDALGHVLMAAAIRAAEAGVA